MVQTGGGCSAPRQWLGQVSSSRCWYVLSCRPEIGARQEDTTIRGDSGLCLAHGLDSSRFLGRSNASSLRFLLHGDGLRDLYLFIGFGPALLLVVYYFRPNMNVRPFLSSVDRCMRDSLLTENPDHPRRQHLSASESKQSAIR